MAAAAAFAPAVRPGPQLPRAVWVSLGAAMLLHAALLTGRREADFEPGRSAGPLQVRMVGMPAQTTAVSAAAKAVEAVPAAEPAAAIAPSDEAMPVASPPAAQPALPAQAVADAPAALHAEAQAAPAAAAATDAPEAEDLYLPRSRLSQAPVSSEAPMLFFPPEFAGYGKFTTVIALFIDERGAVRRVRIEGEPLPAELEATAVQTFEHLRFQPGQLNGEAVKSFIRIEVTFENRVPEHGRLTLGSSS